MKSFFLFFLVFFSSTIFAQTAKTSKVILSISDCRAENPYSGLFGDTILFFKLPEDTLAFKITPRNYRRFPINLGDIPISDYKLKYRNHFKQDMAMLVTVSAGNKNFISICFDTLLSYSQNTLKKLQNKDTVSIAFHSQGCFGGDNIRIVITKKSDEFIATLFYVETKYFEKNGKTYSRKARPTSKSVILTEKHIKDFLRFENELNFARDGGCTTTDKYIIEGKYLNVQKTDGNCSWDGFYYLRKSFFGDPK
ncbi:MAG: hypothetical protein ABJB11_18225 [Ferruginibacter sp.]